MPIINPNEIFVVERGNGAIAPITLKMTDTNAAMSRLHEIRNTNAGTFPELASVFIQASNELFQAIATVRTELIKNEHKLEQLRSRLLIDDVPAIMLARNLKNTLEVSKAIMNQNSEYSELVYTQELLAGAITVLENKLVTLKSAQFAISQIAKLSFEGRFNHRLPQEPLSNRRLDPFDDNGEY